MSTRAEIRGNVSDRARETGINSIINDMINNTLMEIQNPGWAYPRSTRSRPHHHLWNFNRRKTTLSTVTSQEDYELPRDLVEIGLIRQTTSPNKLLRIPDEKFYRVVPNPTATGNPLYYRLWEETGLAVALSTDDAISIVSDNANDGSSFKVTVFGYVSADGSRQSEVITLNGVTTVDGNVTFKADRPMRVTKSGTTTGTITIKEKTAGTVLLALNPQERGARFKIVSFYPIPSADITINLEYFTSIWPLFNDSDEPNMPEDWHWVVEAGTLAKVYEYKQAETMQRFAQGVYANGVRSMIVADTAHFDLITKLRSAAEDRIRPGVLEVSDNTFVPWI